MANITLTTDQKHGYEKFVSFIAHPNERFFVLSGYAGTGKSTLVKYMLDDLEYTIKMAKLLNPNMGDWESIVTATTNKAAEALSQIISRGVLTIQSYLGLRVHNNYKTQTTELVATGNTVALSDIIIFIDEASYIDFKLLKWIKDLTICCKIVFIGDPAQLSPVKGGNSTPVFEHNWPMIKLTEVVRQSHNNPIIDLATAFRDTVNGDQFPSFVPDGHHIRHYSRDDFDNAIVAEFSRPDWERDDAKVLAWTNKTVIAYNHAIRQHLEGVPELQVGDYAVCNKFISNKNCTVRTDETVLITAIDTCITEAIPGWMVEMNNKHITFLPRSLDEVRAYKTRVKKAENFGRLQYIDKNWIDLRAAYACTINKAQGSTYKTVFLDLDDVKKCNQPNLVARMLYVAVSRASDKVYLTGDII